MKNVYFDLLFCNKFNQDSLKKINQQKMLKNLYSLYKPPKSFDHSKGLDKGLYDNYKFILKWDRIATFANLI